MNKEATAEVEVSIYEPAQRFGIKSESMGINAEYIYTLSKNTGGTIVNLDATIHAQRLAKLIAPHFRSSMKKQDSEQLYLLKT